MVDQEKLSPEQMLDFYHACIESQGVLDSLVIKPYNELLEKGLSDIVTGQFRINRNEENQRPEQPIGHFNIQFHFTGVQVGVPERTELESGFMRPLDPNMARVCRTAYVAPLYMGAVVKIEAHRKDGTIETREATIEPQKISSFPVMVGSSRCRTAGLSREERKRLQEDPQDLGGYLISKNGTEVVVPLSENIRFNSPHVHVRYRDNEHVRSEFISRPGTSGYENSSQIRFIYMTNGQVLFQIVSQWLKKIRIPFYVLFRLFGVTRNTEIVSHIVDPESKETNDLLIIKILDKAFSAKTDGYADIQYSVRHDDIVRTLATKMSKYVRAPADEDAVRYLNQRLVATFDRDVLPHIGQSSEDRVAKLKYIGMILRSMLLTHLGVNPPTDRDGLTSKRFHGAGMSMGKAAKQIINNTIIHSALTRLRTELKQVNFDNISSQRLKRTFAASMESGRLDIKHGMLQILSSSQEEITLHRRKIPNRVNAQALQRKCPLNTVCATRTVRKGGGSATASKGTARSEDIRQMHLSHMYFICVAHSADTGPSVGMNPQPTMTTTLTPSSSDIPIKNRLQVHPGVVPLDQMTNVQVIKSALVPVHVNGSWVGSTNNPAAIVEEFRHIRRTENTIDRMASISWDRTLNIVEFWTDVGRFTLLMLIVYNNLPEYDTAVRAGAPIEFRQWIRYTAQHAADLRSGKITVENLIQEGVCEYICPEEMDNCLVSPDIDALVLDRANVAQRYTHCAVPQMLFGMAALVSPFANTTQAVRVTFATTHARHTCGAYCLSWPFRGDTQRFLQVANPIPIVKTISAAYVQSGGQNAIIAYMPFGDNQEDSVVVRQGFVNRGGFVGYMFQIEHIELSKDEVFANPNDMRVSTRPNASYSKLVGKFAPVGTKLEKGDVFIGRISRNVRGRGRSGDEEYVDRSVVYKRNYPAVVDAVWSSRSEEDGSMFMTVRLRYWRHLSVGEKFSTRSGNKCIVAKVVADVDMPYDANGLRPDYIFNDHSLPTRMSDGQMIETAVGKINAKLGATSDATAFKPINIHTLGDRLFENGFRRNGTSRMYNGRTGMWMDVAVFIGPCYMQEIQKFIRENAYAVGSYSAKDALTRQPLQGKNADGGLREGEMEVWTMDAQGSMHMLNSKIREDSDGCFLYFCKTCNQPAIYNERAAIYSCRRCRDMAVIVKIPSRHSANVMLSELSTLGVKTQVIPDPPMFDSPDSKPE